MEDSFVESFFKYSVWKSQFKHNEGSLSKEQYFIFNLEFNSNHK